MFSLKNNLALPRHRELPRNFIAWIILLTGVLLLILGWDLYSVYHNNVMTQDRNTKIDRLQGVIHDLERTRTLQYFPSDFDDVQGSEELFLKLQSHLDSAIGQVQDIARIYYSGQVVSEDGFIKEEKTAGLFSDYKDSEIFMRSLQEMIVHLDDICDLSMRMYLQTQKPLWLKRYYIYKYHMTEAMNQLTRIAPDSTASNTIAKAHIAMMKMMSVDEAAIRFIKEGRLEQAQTVYFSDNYKQQESVFDAHITLLENYIKGSAKIILKLDARRIHIHISFVVFAICFVFIGWLLVIRTFRRWQKTEEEHKRQLEELNHSLDAKVKERTLDLEQKEQKLRQMYTKLNRVHEKVKQTQQQLLQTEKMASIGQLAAGIAHEINNPVGYISSNLQTLEQYVQHVEAMLQSLEELGKAAEREDLKEFTQAFLHMKSLGSKLNIQFIRNDITELVADSQNGIERIRKIISDLRTFAREEKEEKVFCKLGDVIDGAISLVNNEIKYTTDIKCHYSPELPAIQCDRYKIAQVIVNLLINAHQAIEKNGLVEIKTYEDHGFAVIEVSDNGKGIEPKILPRIFEPFFTTKAVGQGTGLGLSVCYEIIKKHNGEIKVCSVVGQGTTFVVMLPLKESLAEVCP